MVGSGDKCNLVIRDDELTLVVTGLLNENDPMLFQLHWSLLFHSLAGTLKQK